MGRTKAAVALAALALVALYLVGQAWQCSVRDARAEGVAYGVMQAQEQAYDRGYADACRS